MRAARALAAFAMTGAANLATAAFGAGVPRFVERAPRPAGEARNPKVAKARRDGRIHDPFFGIKSKGRRGARAAFGRMEQAFTKTAVGKRNAAGRKTGSPFASAARNAVFRASLASGLSHNAALKQARHA